MSFGPKLIERGFAEQILRSTLAGVLSKEIEKFAEFSADFRMGEDRVRVEETNARLMYEVAKELLEEFRSGGPKSCAKPVKGDE